MKMTKRVKKEPTPPPVNSNNDDDDNNNDQQQTISHHQQQLTDIPSEMTRTATGTSTGAADVHPSNTAAKSQSNNNNNNSSSPPTTSGMTGMRFPSDAIGPTAVAARNNQDKTFTLRENMKRELKSGKYECMICLNAVKTVHAIWSCHTCWRAFHMICAKKASKVTGTGAAATSGNPNDESYFARENAANALFRCPACMTENKVPKEYLCFCGKQVDPKADPFLIPHSCGEICGRKRENGCTHPCSNPCHPGPCPTCTFSRDGNRCPCNKTTYSYPCGSVDAKSTCANACGKLLNCGFHNCEKKCHHGKCSPCEIRVKNSCHCGRVNKEMPCGSDEFSCEQVCSKNLRCGNCKCDFTCHKPLAGAHACPPCPRDPSTNTTCPCGKTGLPANIKRLSCTDPIPTCENRCGKVLSCGLHECEELCHDSPCDRCTVKRTATCPCGYNSKKVRCFEAKELVCNKTCGAMMSCGRHTCKDICCPHRREPFATSATHTCTEICGRQLMCGHHCDQICHNGSCPPCPNWILEDLSCGCGAQFRSAPLSCGTVLPPCNEVCPRERPCGHDDLKHTCHFGECPACPLVLEKPCAGGHVQNMKVSCGTDPSTISCGKVCGKPLPWCAHPCSRKCHAGPCVPERAGKKFCTEICNKSLSCGHHCLSKCHVNYGAATVEEALKKECPPCTTEVEVLCDCGIQTIKFSCRDYIKWKEENPDKKTAKCQEDCSFLRREAALRPANFAGASGTGGSGAASDGLSCPFVYSCKLWAAAKQYPDFFSHVEKSFNDLLKDAKCVAEGFKKMNPMNRERRGWVHELAWHYHVSTESVDQEPHRAVLLTRTPATKIPNPVLSDAIYTNDAKGHNPFTLLQEVLSSRAHSVKSVLVFEGERLNDTDLHLVLRPFVGKVVLVSGLEQLRSVPNLASDASQRFYKGEVNAVLAVFATPAIANAAHSHLRKTLCKFLFHMFAQDAPPRNVEDAQGRLRLVQQNACIFTTTEDANQLWENNSASSSSGPQQQALMDDIFGKGSSKKKSKNKNDDDDDDANAPSKNDFFGAALDKKKVEAAKAAKSSSTTTTPSVWGVPPKASENSSAASSTPGSWANMLKK